jgi:hypothetical protein
MEVQDKKFDKQASEIFSKKWKDKYSVEFEKIMNNKQSAKVEPIPINLKPGADLERMKGINLSELTYKKKN